MVIHYAADFRPARLSITAYSGGVILVLLVIAAAHIHLGG